MSGVSFCQISNDDAGQRLDHWMKSHFPGLTFGRMQKLCRTGQIRLDGSRVKPGTRLQVGQKLRLPPLDDEKKAHNQNLKKNAYLSLKDQEYVRSLVIYQDKDIIAINKPAGLAVQGGSKTLRHLDGLLAGLQFKAPEKPRLVHRLDKDTSGVLLLARNRQTSTHLTKSFRSRQTEKTYWALVAGIPRPDSDTLKLPLVKAVTPSGEKMYPARQNDQNILKAATHYETIDTAAPAYAWLELKPETGRKHQIRVHCSAIGHPIVGDGKYGYEKPEGNASLLSGQLHLHARQISFADRRGKKITLMAPLPQHMLESWKTLAFDPERNSGR